MRSESNNGELIWSNPSVTFLDPCTKPGVFLRRYQRLVAGQEDRKDLSERVDRIRHRFWYRIEPDGFVARRSVTAPSLQKRVLDLQVGWLSDEISGSATFIRGLLESAHSVEQMRRIIRGDQLETHAYALIHTDDVVSRLFILWSKRAIWRRDWKSRINRNRAEVRPWVDCDAHLPVCPSGHRSAFIAMVTPSRWFAGGRGLSI